MNSISEPFVSGTPMVIIPFHSDQPINTINMVKIGVAKHLDYKQFSKDTIYNSVLSVINNCMIKDNILKIQKQVLNATRNRGAAKIIIDYYNK